MKFTVYSGFKNIVDYEEGIPILCYPERHSAHDIAMEFDPSQVIILSNQSGLYIKKKKVKKQWFKKKK